MFNSSLVPLFSLFFPLYPKTWDKIIKHHLPLHLQRRLKYRKGFTVRRGQRLQATKLSSWSVSSVSVRSESLRPHGLQHVGLPCPSPTPGACSNSCPLSRWCHPTISSCHPFLFLPSVFPSIRRFSNESALRIRWPKYWSFSLSISPSNEYSGLISFRMDWLDLLEVQGTLKSLLQHHSSKASILQCSAFFMIQLSHP